jgi:hypothetical protein
MQETYHPFVGLENGVMASSGSVNANTPSGVLPTIEITMFGRKVFGHLCYTNWCDDGQGR